MKVQKVMGNNSTNIYIYKRTIISYLNSLNTQNKGNSNIGHWKARRWVGSGSHHTIPLCRNIQIPTTDKDDG